MRIVSIRSLVPDRAAGAQGLPAVVFVIAYAVLLLGLPSRLVLGPLGAPGAPANLVGVGALLWWVCITAGGRNPVRGLTPVRVAVGLLTCSVLASYANGMASGWYAPSDIRQSTDDLYSLVAPTVGEVAGVMVSAADRGLLSYAGWVGILLLTAEGLRSWRDVELLLTWVVWLAAFVATLGIVQFFTGYDIAGLFTIPGLSANSTSGGVVTRSLFNRPASTAIHPIEFGVVMAALFPLALHRTIHGWGRRLALLPTVLIGLGGVMSVSRAGILVTVVTLAVMALGWPRAWRRRALVIAPVVVVGVRLAIPGLVGTIVSLFRNLFNDPSVTGRTDDYGVVLELFADNALLGRGLFTFVPRYYRILDNQYLMVMLELGLVGLAAVVLLVLVGYFSARGVFHHAADARSRHAGLALSAGILGIAVSYATFDAWGFPMAAGTTFLLLGLAGATWRLSEDERRADTEGVAESRPVGAGR